MLVLIQSLSRLTLDHAVRGVLRDGTQCPTIAHIYHINIIVDNHDDNSARTCLVIWLIRRWANEL